MSEVDAIFDAVIAAGARVHSADAIRKLRQRIIDNEMHKCGACVHWMRTTCKLEKEHGQFKSAGTLACSAFMWKKWDAEFLEELKAELKKLLAEYAAKYGPKEQP